MAYKLFWKEGDRVNARANLRWGFDKNVEENRRDIAEQEKEIKRLCKLRDAAKAMEKASGLKMGEMDKRVK